MRSSFFKLLIAVGIGDVLTLLANELLPLLEVPNKFHAAKVFSPKLLPCIFILDFPLMSADDREHRAHNTPGVTGYQSVWNGLQKSSVQKSNANLLGCNRRQSSHEHSSASKA